MKKLILLTTLLLSLMAAHARTDHYVSDTKYDWSGAAKGITAGKTTNYDKFYAIYRWLCDNIAYDTTYSIYTADGCYENGRGVCQAYSELFYRLAQAVGLKVDIISGYAKTDGVIDDAGHAWIFAYTDPDNGVGILIDPTWGAGSVSGGNFMRSINDDSWFHVDPAWMIFTHFPKDDDYQLLGGRKLTIDDFRRLSDHSPNMSLFGFDGHQILQAELSGRRMELPMCYASTMREFGVERAQLPSERNITVGTPITLALKTNVPIDRFRMIGKGCGPHFNKGEWQRQGDYLYCRFTPARQGVANIGVLNPQGSYTTIASFDVKAPTGPDIARLEAADPTLSPVWDTFSGCSPQTMADRGVDLTDMISAIRAGRVKSLPTFYTKMDYKVRRVPYEGTLRIGQTYDIEFMPPSGSECAVLNGTKGNYDWAKDWTINPDTGSYSIRVTPQKEGELQIAVKGSDNLYYCCIIYQVSR